MRKKQSTIFFCKNPVKNLLDHLKFKNVISNKDACDAYKSLENEAKIKHNNRGAAAGVLNEKKLPAYVKRITKRQKFRAYYIGKDGKVLFVDREIQAATSAEDIAAKLLELGIPARRAS